MGGGNKPPFFRVEVGRSEKFLLLHLLSSFPSLVQEIYPPLYPPCEKWHVNVCESGCGDGSPFQ